MSVSLRVKGWASDGTIDVPADTIGAMADMASDLRTLTAENVTLRAHSDALREMVRALDKHGSQSEQFSDAAHAARRVLA